MIGSFVIDVLEEVANKPSRDTCPETCRGPGEDGDVRVLGRAQAEAGVSPVQSHLPLVLAQLEGRHEDEGGEGQGTDAESRHGHVEPGASGLQCPRVPLLVFCRHWSRGSAERAKRKQGALRHQKHTHTHRGGCSFMWHQPCQRCKYTISVDIQNKTKMCYNASHSCRSTCERSESAQESGE